MSEPVIPLPDKCLYEGHDWEELIDPQSGGFMRCKRCGHAVDCEGED
jgi:hypothetical protein